jgi:ketosteroid isomerase-like protein
MWWNNSCIRLCEIMATTQETNIALIRSYLQALESGATGDRLAAFFADDAVQIEFPNRLNPAGGTSDLATILARAETGQRLLKKQSYQIALELAQDDKVAVEALWTGTLAVAMGSLAEGAEMKAHFAMFFVIENEKIKVQRNYDCFSPS